MDEDARRGNDEAELIEDVGFRESANADPHGTQAIAMALSQEEREQLGAPLSKGTKAFVLGWGVGATALVSLATASRDLVGATVPAVAFVSLAIVSAMTVTSRRFRFSARALEVSDWRGRSTSHPWRDVESLTIDATGSATARVRIDGELATRRAASAGGRRLVLREAPLLIPTEERELAGGARAAIGGLLGGLGVVLGIYATAFAAGAHAATGTWRAMSVVGLLYLLVGAAITYRTRLTAKRDGLHLPSRVIPWQRIQGAAPRSRSGQLEVRVYLDGQEEVTVFCGNADQAVTEINARRDVARRMRVERDT